MGGKMIKLFNLSNHDTDLGKFGFDHSRLDAFIRNFGFDGIELIQNNEWKEEQIPSRHVKGMHMRFWPVWLDFWNGNGKELLKQFGSMETVCHYYGGDNRKAMVSWYKKEIETAVKLNVKYVVFHISHVLPEHCFSYKFTYVDSEVIKAGIELLNEVMDGVTGEFRLLVENLWWPGLTLLDGTLAKELIDGVRYPYKGFMLDISHVMNTNLQLSDEDGAVDYILRVLENLGGLSGLIKGIHLNSSLSGEYVKSQFGNSSIFEEKDFFKRYIDSYKHVLNIDRHVPFESTSIRRVLDFVKPEYLVYEFLTDNIERLEELSALQNKVLGF
ncbi:MAG: TIM barrel protein [Ruminiclostridium sp.]|nr:TIM barrel protein [Ruminiclostridium sp.]